MELVFCLLISGIIDLLMLHSNEKPCNFFMVFPKQYLGLLIPVTTG